MALVNLIPCKEGVWSGQACLAMLAEVSMEEAIEAMGTCNEATTGQIIDALIKLKIEHNPRRIVHRNRGLPPCDAALVWLKDTDGKRTRMALFANGFFYDPTLPSPVQKPARATTVSYLRVSIPKRARQEKHRERRETVDERIARYARYRNGAEGFIEWAEEHICIKVTQSGAMIPVWTSLADLPDTPDPVTGRSYKELWEKQKEVVRRALVLKNGKFKHRLIVLCWPRGEGKTFVVCYIQMWKFFCWPNQEIMLCANSKDQTKFVQYGIIRKIIENSPKLLRLVGSKNIQEKEIKITDRAGNVVSFIRSMSNFTGIVSNITGYAFSELFQLKDHEFFQQVDGSIRNMPNAFGVIDSTVSPKDHILYRLYQSYTKNEDETLFFDYRFSKAGNYQDYWHPEQSQQQLNSYRTKFILGGFERYFQNLWSAGTESVFTREQVDAVGYMGVDMDVKNHKGLIEVIEKRNHIIDQVNYLASEGVDMESRSLNIDEIERRLWSVDMVYALNLQPKENMVMASIGALEALSEILDTDWAILAGMDRADPMKTGRTAARTIVTVVAKGLPGSASNVSKMRNTEDERKKAMGLEYVYYLIALASIGDHSLDGIKTFLSDAADEFGGIDVIGGERWGMWDLEPWTKDEEIELVAWQSSYSVHQRAMFGELYTLADSGRFKSPAVRVEGSRDKDILREELLKFDHDDEKKKFGSPEKTHKYGIQDDSVYALAGAIYGGRLKTVFDFQSRRNKAMFWGAMHHPSDLLGNYPASEHMHQTRR